MIKYNNSNINDWYFDTSDIIKVYRNGAVVYCKVISSGSTPTYDVCYAVVDDISQYQETEFEDVFDKATEKWYKLNNLNQYEEYGVYGSGRNITYYEGKLTIDDGYEYIYSGSSWVNLGEISGETYSYRYWMWRSIGDLGSQNILQFSEFDLVVDGSDASLSLVSAQPSGFSNEGAGNLFDNNTSTKYCANFASYKTTNYVLFAAASVISPTVFSMTTANDNASNDRYPREWVLYGSDTSTTNWNDGSWNMVLSGTCGTEMLVNYTRFDYDIWNQAVYPVYYDEKSDPLDNLSFSSMTEANEYAYNNCVYDGMKATIDGDRYYFDSEDENGWVKILEYYKVEDVTSGGASGWTISGSSTYNPDSSYYDDFDLQTSSTSNVTKIAKVTINGYDHFTYYLRTSGYSNYCYVVATNVDEVQTPPSTMSYNSASAITNTFNWNKSPKSAVNLSNYRRVTYNNLDKTVEHTFYVYFYGRTYSSYVGNATILIPKEQTNENWEQVTFSASSNVASAQKNLYIDNNNSTSGGTSYWYYRWMIGLPSGSHSSYTNYIGYDYCGNVTSSTFTSVAGESRQVDYTYDNATTKSLNFRLVDESGNTLTPSDTVYYSLTGFNSCNASYNYGSYSYPTTFYGLKVGGKLRFGNSSNRHYIYGYSPNISLNTDYYVDNYTTYFDIPYTKLDTEAVTVTYTTYDPNDAETPAFRTDITYPYSGGTTSSTTLTSYDVPYTYPYTVLETNDKFSANSQSFTASESARTVTFTLYPNKREFSTVADMEAYAYAWEGMRASVGGTNYKYENGEWVEIQHTVLEYLICGDGSTTKGGLQLLNTVTSDYYFEVEGKCNNRSGSPCFVQQKSSVEIVSYQMGLSFYTSMYLDYGGGRLNTSIYSTTQGSKHLYGAGHISGSSNSNVIGVKIDGVVNVQTNANTTVEALPYLVGDGIEYSGHTASDVKINTNNKQVRVYVYSVKIYTDYGETLVGDYVPVRTVDNVVTLYDKISGNYATPFGVLVGSDEV